MRVVRTIIVNGIGRLLDRKPCGEHYIAKGEWLLWQVQSWRKLPLFFMDCWGVALVGARINHKSGATHHVRWHLRMLKKHCDDQTTMPHYQHTQVLYDHECVSTNAQSDATGIERL
jgi:hypothetical protein